MKRAHISIERTGRRYRITVVLPDSGPMGVAMHTAFEDVIGDSRAYSLALGMKWAYESLGFEVALDF